MRKPNAFHRAVANRRRAGFSLVEVMISAGVVVIAFFGAIQTFVFTNSRAVVSRLRTNARAVVERNIEQALSQKFTSTILPAILATTVPTGVVYDDDGNGDGKVNVVVQDGTAMVTVPGTLTRTVTAITNENGANIRQVTFSLEYNYRGRDYTYAASTARSRD